MMKNVKPQFGDFNLRGLNELVKQLNENPSILNSMEWRDIGRKTFGMTEQQSNCLATCPIERNQEIQEKFHKAANHIKGGGRINLKVIQEDKGNKKLYLVFMPNNNKSQKKPILQEMMMIAIICCDANCGDWEWC